MTEPADQTADVSTLPARVTVPGHVLFQHVEGHAVLMDTREERYYSMDDVGSRIWGFLGETSDTEQVVARMLETYAVDEATLRADVAAFVARLSAAGLLVVEA